MLLNLTFIAGVGLALGAVLWWGIRNLPAERWQMLAAIPIAKTADGSWRGLNLTFYGFFSASGTTFGLVIMLLLLSSVGLPTRAGAAFVLALLAVCIAASRIIAGLVEHKRNTFTVAGGAFVASIALPLLTLALEPLTIRVWHRSPGVLPVVAAAAIGYALGESLGRLACLSFGCCYGVPLRKAPPVLARLFHKHNLVLEGGTKKASYAANLAGEPLLPVQAITSVIYAVAGIAGMVLFVARFWRVSALVPLLATWGWRACSELLREDYRGEGKIPVYQIMAIVAMVYSMLFVVFLPADLPVIPNLPSAVARVFSLPVLAPLEAVWIAVFLYYGTSRVTGSTLSFHVFADRI